jgi:hypothetical protein
MIKSNKDKKANSKLTNDVGFVLNSYEEKMRHKLLADIEALRKKEI